MATLRVGKKILDVKITTVSGPPRLISASYRGESEMDLREVNQRVVQLLLRVRNFVHGFYTQSGLMPSLMPRVELSSKVDQSVLLIIMLDGLFYDGLAEDIYYEKFVLSDINKGFGSRSERHLKSGANGRARQAPGSPRKPVDLSSEEESDSDEGEDDTLFLREALGKRARVSGGGAAKTIKNNKVKERRAAISNLLDKLRSKLNEIIDSVAEYDGLHDPVIFEFSYFVALIDYLWGNYDYYFSGAFSEFEEVLEKCLSDMEPHSKSYKSISDFIEEKKMARVNGSSSLEVAFTKAYSVMGASRTPTYYMYHNISRGQGPHTIARVLSVRSNISFIKRIFSDEMPRAGQGQGQGPGEISVDGVRLAKLIEYVLFVVLSMEELSLNFNAWKGLVSLREIDINNTYRFFVASTSMADFRPTGVVSSGYVLDVSMVVENIIKTVFVVCADNNHAFNDLVRILGGNNVIIDQILTNDIKLRVVEHKKRLALRFNELSKSIGRYDLSGAGLVNQLTFLVTLLQVFHDMHPCGSAATSAINNKDLAGKGELTLYKDLVWEKLSVNDAFSADFNRKFISKAVDLRFSAAGVAVDVSSIGVLNNENYFRSYFPETNFAIKAKKYVIARLTAIMALHSLHPWLGREANRGVPPRSFSARDFARQLSPTRFKKDYP